MCTLKAAHRRLKKEEEGQSGFTQSLTHGLPSDGSLVQWGIPEKCYLTGAQSVAKEPAVGEQQPPQIPEIVHQAVCLKTEVGKFKFKEIK